jgi:hypothetical protein
MKLLLADQKHIHSAQVEIIVEGKSSDSLIAGMHTGIELSEIPDQSRTRCRKKEFPLTMTVLPLY